MSNHPEKAEKFKNNLSEQENGQYFVRTLFNTIKEDVNSGEFQPVFSLNNIFMYITTTIDGIVNKVVLQKYYRANEHSIDVINIFKIISKFVLYMLVVK